MNKIQNSDSSEIIKKISSVKFNFQERTKFHNSYEWDS